MIAPGGERPRRNESVGPIFGTQAVPARNLPTGADTCPTCERPSGVTSRWWEASGYNACTNVDHHPDVMRPTGADDLAARLRFVAESVGPACSVFLAIRDEPILYGYELADAADELDRHAARIREDEFRMTKMRERIRELEAVEDDRTWLRAELDDLGHLADELAARIDRYCCDECNAALDRWEQARGRTVTGE